MQVTTAIQANSVNFFEFDIDNEPSDIALAITFASFVGKSFNSIYYDLELPIEIINQLEKYHNDKVHVKKIVSNYSHQYQFFDATTDKIFLNFSGGLDSLAAKMLLPEDKVKLGGNLTFSATSSRNQERINFVDVISSARLHI